MISAMMCLNPFLFPTMDNIGSKFFFQKNEVANSYNMELEGLKRGVEWMEQMDLELGTIITDRHVQVRAWIRDNLGHAKHYFDVWHISKGMRIGLYA